MINQVSKRTFDFAIALIGLFFLWPVGLFIAVAIKISSPGPVFFIQQRIGQYGKIFNCIKFRTMRTGTCTVDSITASSDNRITTLGKFLRRYKLDELPQLWNVLTGKMSFVGPRPDVPGYADKLEGDDRIVLEIKPGITGPASFFFRNEEELLARAENKKEYNDNVIWPQKVMINKSYVLEWSFWKDIGLIIITIFPPLNSLLKIVKVDK